MLDGFRKADPPTTKQLLVKADVPEYLVKLGQDPEARKLDRVIVDLTMIALANTPTMSAKECSTGFDHDGGRRHPEVRQPKEWMEGSVCLSRVKCGASMKTILSAYYHDSKRGDVTSDHISKTLKLAATALELRR